MTFPPLNSYSKNHMKKIVIPALFLAFFLFAEQAANAQDWIEPTSPGELIGLWESNTTLPISANPAEMMPESSIGLIIIFDYRESGEKAGNNYKLSVRLDMSRFLDDFMFIPDIKALGLSKDSLWNILLQNIENAGTTLDVTFGKYFISYTVSENISEFFTKSNRGQIFINTARNRILLSFNDDLSQGFSDREIKEVILVKR